MKPTPKLTESSCLFAEIAVSLTALLLATVAVATYAAGLGAQ